jgi:hypothetical protein
MAAHSRSPTTPQYQEKCRKLLPRDKFNVSRVFQPESPQETNFLFGQTVILAFSTRAFSSKYTNDFGSFQFTKRAGAENPDWGWFC